MAEKNIFIRDYKSDSTSGDRNLELSTSLAAGAIRTQDISRIDRGKVDGKEGWIIYYEEGTREISVFYADHSEIPSKDRTYYQELLKLPPKLRTAIQQYLVYFKEYVRKAKGKEIGFETCTHEEGLQLLFEKQEGEELQSIYGYLKEYLGFIEKHIDELEVVVETNLSNEEKNLLILDLRDEKRALESRIERKEIENKLLSGQLERISHLFETELKHRQPTIVSMQQVTPIAVNIALQIHLTQQIQTDLGELGRIIEKEAPGQVKELADIQKELKDIPPTATDKDLVGPLAKVGWLLKQLSDENSALNKIIRGSRKAAGLIKQLASAYHTLAPQFGLPPIDGLMM